MLKGSGSIIAKVVSVQNTSSNAKAGIMIRTNLTAASAMIDLIMTPTQVQFFHRGGQTGIVVEIVATNASTPLWLQLAYTGTYVTALTSPDGVNWTTFASTNVLPGSTGTPYIGLVDTSHSMGVLSTDVFSNVSVTGLASSGYVWINNNTGTLAALNASGAQELRSGTGGAASTAGGIAIDASGSIWSVGAATNALNATVYPGGTVTAYQGGGLSAPVATAVDGSGYIWVANSGNNSLSLFSNGGSALTGTAGYGAADFLTPSSVAIDRSGGVWVTNKKGNSISHVFGAAAPVVTPLSTAVTNAKLGVKP